MSTIRQHYGHVAEVHWKWHGDWQMKPKCPWCGSDCAKQEVQERRLEPRGQNPAILEIARQAQRPSQSHCERMELFLDRVIWTCPACGWWTAKLVVTEVDHALGDDLRFRSYFAGALRKFDVASSQIPLQLLRDHLHRFPGDIHHISPDRMEALVKSVFSEFYNCEVHYFRGSTNTAVGGIDLVTVQSDGGIKTAIQVKRRKRDVAEAVDLVREFVGAMVLEGFERGVCVTTGHFSRKALQVPGRLSHLAYGRRLSLELIPGARLLEMLAETQGEPFDEAFWQRTVEYCADPLDGFREYKFSPHEKETDN